MLYFVFYFYVYMKAVANQLPRFGKRELIFMLSFTCYYVIFLPRGFLFRFVLAIGCVTLLWHSLVLPYNYFDREKRGSLIFVLCHFTWYPDRNTLVKQ